MSARVWVVIPTYNEADNVERIVTATDRELGQLEIGGHQILIVDDNSPDGTGELADRLAAEHSTVSVLHRAGKNGLGHAYLAGFHRALEHNAELICEMDADYSHDPAYLKDLLAAAATADLVLGSRYTAGGGVHDWGLIRRLVSRGGGLYARIILGVRVKDLTGGFKCIHRRVLEAIDLDSVRAEGYVFQIEVTYRAMLAGFTVAEVPIIFTDRTHGTSKMSTRIALEAMLLVPRMRRNARAAMKRSPKAAV
ncbi:MAG TPA: polyprenol monophosphomannose synthase [Solirubrobacteraceae bacterium]|jgi:dolichol-phosphate mannosyltransferase|nr:polyprenol monophosphomannose synthase [Solirubrobacteraceae bacterium]